MIKKCLFCGKLLQDYSTTNYCANHWRSSPQAKISLKAYIEKHKEKRRKYQKKWRKEHPNYQREWIKDKLIEIENGY